MRSLQGIMEKNCQELQDLLPVVSCLAGSKEAKEQLWGEVFRFMDQVMPTDTADCSLELLAGDAFNTIAYADQVLLQLCFQLTEFISGSVFHMAVCARGQNSSASLIPFGNSKVLPQGHIKTAQELPLVCMCLYPDLEDMHCAVNSCLAARPAIVEL